MVQHLAPEGPYAIADALSRTGVDVEVALVADGAPPARLSGFNGLVVMGGPMSASSDEGFPTRAGELALLHEALSRSLPTLGVCLGAQLLAVAAGAKVVRGMAGPEIGWGQVRLSPQARSDPLFCHVGPELAVLHWHSETFSLPPGAVHLASSPVYRNQAFRLGDAAWGLQFHLEVDAGAVGAFVESFAPDLEAVGLDPSRVAADSARWLPELAPVRDRVLDSFSRLVARGSPSTGRPARDRA